MRRESSGNPQFGLMTLLMLVTVAAVLCRFRDLVFLVPESWAILLLAALLAGTAMAGCFLLMFGGLHLFVRLWDLFYRESVFIRNRASTNMPHGNHVSHKER